MNLCFVLSASSVWRLDKFPKNYGKFQAPTCFYALVGHPPSVVVMHTVCGRSDQSNGEVTRQ